MSLIKDYYNAIKWSKPEEHARRDYTVFNDTMSELSLSLNNVSKKKILDVGCGRLFPMPLLFHSEGAEIIGIDMANIDTTIAKRVLGKTRQTINPLPMVRFYYKYYAELKSIAAFPIIPAGLDIRQMDACNMQFPNDYFDYVISNAAFEHINDIDGLSKEMCRVMKKGAITRIAIHLFPSLTGGHRALYSPPGTDIVILKGKPWDHLRSQIQDKVKLNRLREKNYRTIFERDFTILRWYCSLRDPESFLTPELEVELSGWSRDELLRREIVVVLKKE